MGDRPVISILGGGAEMIYGFSKVEGELKLRRSSQKGEKERKEQADTDLSDRMSSHGSVGFNFSHRSGRCQLPDTRIQ
jgi:hypothetical protein